MKNTGIIRKIDELGRIVIPKEIRKNLNIKDFDSLEIYLDNNNIILSKYNNIDNIKDDTNYLINKLDNVIDAKLLISDKERIVSNNEYKSFIINDDLKDLIEERKSYVSLKEETIQFGRTYIKGHFLINPIIKDSDSIGLIILIKKEIITSEDIIFSKIIKKIIENN